MSYTNVKIIADTLGNGRARITTFEVHCPRFLLAELNTHRIISKSAASSRAIPVAKRIEMVEKEPWFPAQFGKNKPGMQADEALTDEDDKHARMIWNNGIQAAIVTAEGLNTVKTHKQHANRPLETYAYVDIVLTATEWDNFWTLRTHSDAQPEFQELARVMKDAYASSVPRHSMYHLPYTDDCPKQMTLEELFYISAARCARVSYKTQEGRSSTLEEDLALCKRLLDGGHMSPFDHPARADHVYMDDKNVRWWNAPTKHRQYWGWMPYRVDVEAEKGMVGRRCSFAALPEN